MINNISYLTQCNSFKHFRMTMVGMRMSQTIDPKYSFFKFCKADTLSIRGTPNYNLLSQIKKFQDTWQQIENISRKFNDLWIYTLLESISTLNLSSDYLPFLPINILFNSDKSNLKTIEFYCSYQQKHNVNWRKYMEKFEEKYLDLRENLEEQKFQSKSGINSIKILECIKYTSLCQSDIALKRPRFVSAKHLWFECQTIDLTSDEFFTNNCHN